MMNDKTKGIKQPQKLKGSFALLCLCGVLINVLGKSSVTALGLPLFLDTLGTILAAAVGGALPGILVGFFSNLLNSVFDQQTVYYGMLNVMIAVLAARFARKDGFRRIPMLLLAILVFALIGGGLGSVLTWFLNDFGTGADLGGNAFLAQLWRDLLIDLADKALVCVLAALILKLLPSGLWERFRFYGLQQAPLSEEMKITARSRLSRKISLRDKVLIAIAAATLLSALTATGVSVLLYHRTTVAEHMKLGRGVAGLVSITLDPERIDDYLTRGEQAEGYRETEEQLYRIRESSPDIEYIYVYQIREDGCHVVFDLDTEDLEGAEPGEIIPFDESFEPYLPTLLTGGTIEPLITNDTYGWLLTVYVPVYRQDGSCCCYAAADISMGQLTEYEIVFFVRVISLFIGFFILLLALGLYLAEYNIILPINTMALAADAFAYDSEAARAENVERLGALDIHTGDEIENLYRALAKTTEDTMRYIGDVKEKSETITQMQNGLILVLADIVESRDQCTGNHIRKTAAYTQIILNQMRKDGIYADLLSDDYISNVVNSAPLHDIGKIQVPDAILNKHGKLTDEEFREMKTHTTAGGEIISKAIALVPDAGYLAEAKNLATYHHERWDGRGYPTGLKGEEIPLSARIMAVADVFDALVSRRSYKEPFTFEAAMNIIREGVGSHFDPQVAEAFLRAEPEVRRVAEQFRDQ